jgi:hypothetical protein
VDQADFGLVIGSAKDLVEATARAVVDATGETAPNNFDYQDAINAAHAALEYQLGEGLAPDASVRQVAAASKKIASRIREIRNEYGTGHGRAQLPLIPAELPRTVQGLLACPDRAGGLRRDPDAGFVDSFASNDRLSAMMISPLGGETGPETIVVGADGKLYTGVASGKVLRMNPDLTDVETIANTGGRVLGLTFDGKGTLLVADAVAGLLVVDSDGTCRTLLDGGPGPQALGSSTPSWSPPAERST